jgi:hypothetical protein
MARVTARNEVRQGWAGWGRTTQHRAYSDTATRGRRDDQLGQAAQVAGRLLGLELGRLDLGMTMDGWAVLGVVEPLGHPASDQLELGNLGRDVTCSTGSLNRRSRIAGRLPLSQRDTPGGKVDSTIRS